jgi:hypothetical protein
LGLQFILVDAAIGVGKFLEDLETTLAERKHDVFT